MDIDAEGQGNLARVREIAAVAIIEATAKQRLQRGDERDQIVAQQRSEHQFVDLVDIWYDFSNKDIRGWMGPSADRILQ